jgi:maleylacetate reductase
MLASVLRYNKPYVEAAQRRLAEALGAPELDAADAFERFTKKLGLPGSLRDVGITPEQFSDIARAAMPHRFVQANPGPLRDEKAIVSLLELAA